MFLFFLAGALIITLTITLVLVALRNDDEAPSDTTGTVEVTLPATTLPPTTEVATTTEPSTAPGATTTTEILGG